MPYADSFRGTNMDARPEEQFPAEVKEVENARLAYREIVEAAVLVLKRRGLTALPRRKGYDAAIDRRSFYDIAALMECQVKDALRTLEDHNYDYGIEGDNQEMFFDRMYALLKSGPVERPLEGKELEALISGLGGKHG